MKQLTFYTIKERQPKDNEEIFYIRRGSSFGFETIEILYDRVEWQYEEIIDGEYTGTS